MRAYSLDLRQRIISALEVGQGVHAVAERFAVSSRSVRRYRQQWRQEGTLTARPIPGRQRLITAACEAALAAQVAAYPDATLSEHSQRWAESTGVALSPATLCRTLQRLALTVKKSG